VKGSLGSLKQASKSWLKRGLRRAVEVTTPAKRGIPPGYFELGGEDAGSLAWGGVELSSLAERFGSPLHVVNLARLKNNARRYLAEPPGVGARCEVYYSYKTNPVPGVLTELHRAGVGAEVISHYELWLALKLGVPPAQIVYNGPAKSPESIRQAIELGIGLLNINHREEIPVVARIAAELGKRPRVGLRVSLGGWAGQFGTPAAGGHALAAFEEALRTNVLDVVGLHVHRGGMMRGEAEVVSYIDGVLGFADEVRERLGLSLEILDFGGSLGSPSVRPLSEREVRLNRTLLRELEPPNPAEALTIEQYTATLLARVTQHYRQAGRPVPRVFLEPGRSLTSDAQLLLTRVLSLRDEGDKAFAICDAGVNLAESCRSEFHQILRAAGRAPGQTRTYTIVGPICTPGDTLRWAVRLPELAVGDTLAIMDAGAYFVPFATSFSFPRPAIVVACDGAVAPLRRAETFEDLTLLDVDSVEAS
jgi:diaminopimelate decarboxylase